MGFGELLGWWTHGGAGGGVPGEGMEALCTFPQTLPYALLLSGIPESYFYNKLVI